MASKVTTLKFAQPTGQAISKRLEPVVDNTVQRLPRLKIAHVLLSRGFAGTERSTVESCNYQCAQHDVILIIRKGQGKSSGAGVIEKLDPRVRILEVAARFFTRRNIQSIVDEEQPDVLHAHLRRATRLLSKIKSAAAKVSTLHIGINGAQFLEMDGLIAISPWQLDTIPRHYRGEARWIRNSLEPHPKPSAEQVRVLRKALGVSEGTFLIGGVGRLCDSKGWDVLIKAFKQAKLDNSKLILIGEGRARRQLQKEASGHAIQFLGFQHNVKDYYPIFDVFVCPSREEPMGRVILESIDAGVPVIASDAAGPKDILNEYPGRLVPVNDVAALAQALIDAKKSGAQTPYADLSPHFSEKVNTEMLRFYSELIDAKASI